jgi:hypothetical protein
LPDGGFLIVDGSGATTLRADGIVDTTYCTVVAEAILSFGSCGGMSALLPGWKSSSA